MVVAIAATFRGASKPKMGHEIHSIAVFATPSQVAESASAGDFDSPVAVFNPGGLLLRRASNPVIS
jgi:hypothetical protein